MTTTAPTPPQAPCLTFKRFAVVLHFVDPTLRMRRQPARRSGADDANFASFVEDLLSYRPVADPYFFSETWTGTHVIRNVTLTIPADLTFEAEGDDEEKFFPPPFNGDGQEREYNLGLRVSRTTFRSGVVIWHVALVGVDESHSALTEYELIALSQLWQGQDTAGLRHSIRFQPTLVEPDATRGDGTPKAFVDFASDLMKAWPMKRDDAEGADESDKASHPTRRKPLKVVGTVQLLHEESKNCSTDWDAVWIAAKALANGDQPELQAEEGDVIALAGIVCGVLDFKAIDASELRDVFRGHEIDESLLGVHKGTILSVSLSDRSYDSAKDEIGVSPYLLFPQAVLLHNEAVLRRARARLLTAKPKDGRRPVIGPAPGTLERAFNDARAWLATYVPNPFHYPSEQFLYSRGASSRGLEELRGDLIVDASTTEDRWEQAVEGRRNVGETIRNFFLAALTLISLFEHVHSHRWRLLLVGLAVVATLVPNFDSIWRWLKRLLPSSQPPAPGRTRGAGVRRRRSADEQI